MTGRGLGYCGGYGVPGYLNPVGRVGWGGGWGRGGWGYGFGGGGRGWRNMYYATGLPGWARYGTPAYPVPPAPAPTSEQELTVLKEQADYLRNQLDAISKRIDEIEQK